ncbi:MAG: hypothetical protein HAW62_03515 [Endozoicomonadaceae bacterium]|nr:hypothetical protein [Endozoicomonadaceae bacterium]
MLKKYRSIVSLLKITGLFLCNIVLLLSNMQTDAIAKNIKAVTLKDQAALIAKDASDIDASNHPNIMHYLTINTINQNNQSISL